MKYDVIAIGELLIDMTATFDYDGIKYLPNPGGAPANYLAMAQILGSKTAFIGKVGDDYFGHLLINTLNELGINTESVILDQHHPTTLAFVHLDKGETSFSFYRNQTADVMLSSNEVNYDLINSARAVYFGSLGLTCEPIKSSVLKFLKIAKELKKDVFFDPNYRSSLWVSEEQAREEIIKCLSFVDVLKLSEEELRLITNEQDLEKAIKLLNKYSITLIIITRGKESTLFCYKGIIDKVATYSVQMIDSTGAGDAFFGSVTQQLLDNDKRLEEYSLGELKKIIDVANIVASICVENYGGIPSLPNKDSVRRRLRMLKKYEIFI